jgi:diguanylate cyclase (GGDEF)-like protein
VSLRTRLWLVLGGLFLVPLLVAGLVLLVVVPDARDDRLGDSVRTGAPAVAAELSDLCLQLGLAVRNVVLESAVSSPQQAVDAVIAGGYADYAVVVGTDGAPLAEAGGLGRETGPPAALPQCSGRGSAGGLLAERLDVSGVEGAATAVVAVELTRPLLEDLLARSAPDAQVVVLDGVQPVASSTDSATAVEIAQLVGEREGTVSEAGWTVRVAEAGSGVPYRVAVAARDGTDVARLLLILLIAVAGIAAAGLLVTVVSRSLSQPFTELTEAAERVAQGDLDVDIASTGEDGEAGRLGSAISQVSGELRRSLGDLERSRADLQVSLQRIGDALSSTHDLDGLLHVVLDTAVVTLGARAGVVVYRSAETLRLVSAKGLSEAGLTAPERVAPGVGVLGRVYATGETVRGRLGSGPESLTPAPGEPDQGDVVAVPLRGGGSVVGVLAVYGRTDAHDFDATDEDALGTLAGQASIAIDNVQLHLEAQRLSTTDPLTGLWNFRYLSMSLAREIERSTRFDRPLAVLMLDLDHFKSVNDSHGHARGDSVLREMAHRVQEQIREVDTFARYGGEEFVVVLPETGVEGAGQLAERICNAVRREPFRSDGEEPLNITVSVGGAAFPEHGSSPATLMRAADKALYVAKESGRDRWHVPES